MAVEICIDRIESALAALAGGADRIEVCGALGVDGVTPSYGLVEQCVELGQVEVMMLIRPHAGGFCYGAGDVETMLRDIRAAKQLGVRGVVFGALRGDGRIDREVCRRLLAAARPLTVTFHRAFDLTPDPYEALDCLLELGIERVLTSGQAVSAWQGAGLIRQLAQRAGSRIAVMAGAGIRAPHVAPLLRTTGVREIHASASDVVAMDDSAGQIVHATRLTRPEIVRAIVQAMREHTATAALT